jgi:hypothetical protein
MPKPRSAPELYPRAYHIVLARIPKQNTKGRSVHAAEYSMSSRRRVENGRSGDLLQFHILSSRGAAAGAGGQGLNAEFDMQRHFGVNRSAMIALGTPQTGATCRSI